MLHRPGRRGRAALVILGMLAGCAVPPAPPPAAPPAPTAHETAAPPAQIARARSRWHLADWSQLPGWTTDRPRDAFVAFRRGCDRPLPGFAAVCGAALLRPPDLGDDAAVRAWFERHFVPYRIESPDGNAEGLATGYFEPLVAARRSSAPGFGVPLHAPPADLASKRPYWTRQQLETVPAASAALRGREIAFVADPLDALLLQVQGSGRLLLTENDGSRRSVRVAFAGHNDQPYRSIGRWLVEQGELSAEQASWPAIRAWARANPARQRELLWANPRTVFFREEPLGDPAVGPRGAMGVPLTPGRSIAVDPASVPYGTPVWIATTEPLAATPLERLVVAQDTGSAITGAVRADYFWGWGDEAEAQAGRMRQPLRMWALWPRRP